MVPSIWDESLSLSAGAFTILPGPGHRCHHRRPQRRRLPEARLGGRRGLLPAQPLRRTRPAQNDSPPIRGWPTISL